MRWSPLRLGGACLLAALLAACATRPSPPAGFAQLRGWEREDHRAVVQVFRDGCGVAKDAAVRAVCDRARAFEPRNDAAARRFLERNFRVEAIEGEGLLTAYFTPQYEARARREGEFSRPVVAGGFRGAQVRQEGELSRAAFAPSLREMIFPDTRERKSIETDPRLESRALAWMRPEELFFMQLQGSAVLSFPEGRVMKAVTVSTNDRPFVGIAKVMRERGLLADGDTSGEAIMAWLAAHRGPEADEIMRQNPRYGFFRLEPFTGSISGAAGVPLAPGRAIAVDPGSHAYGGLYWVDADAPALRGAVQSYRRAVVALDTGGAIKGAVRADLYLGQGAAAGREAGRVRHRLRLYRLVPVR